MPTLTTSSSFSQHGDQYTLSLRVSHHLILGEPGTGVFAVSTKQLQDLDVAPWHEGISLVLRAAEHRTHKISADVLQTSSLFGHFRDSLHVNLDGLGVDDSQERLDGDKLYIDLSIDPPSSSRPPQLYLRAIHLDYVWKATQEGAEAHIFSPNLLLPDVRVLDALFQRFIVYHLVGRYPLILGPYSHRIDAERKLFPSISRNVLTIAVRSPNASHRKSTRKLIARMRASHEREIELISSRLSLLAPNADEPTESVEKERVTDMRVIDFALERLYRKALRPRRFKAKVPSGDPSHGRTIHEDRLDSDLEIDAEDGARSTQPATHDHTSELHEDVFLSSEGFVALEQENEADVNFGTRMLDLFAAEGSDDAFNVLDEDEDSLLFLDDGDVMISGDDYDDIFSPRPCPSVRPIEQPASRYDHNRRSALFPEGSALRNPENQDPSDTQEDHNTTLDFDLMTDDAEWPQTPGELSPSLDHHHAKPYSRAPSLNAENIDILDVNYNSSQVKDADLWTDDDYQYLSDSPRTAPSVKETSQEDYITKDTSALGARNPVKRASFDLASLDDDDCLSFDDD